jgi:hypothetical protein
VRQAGSGGSTALEFTAADSNNNNKNLLITTDGGVGIGTQRPHAKLDVAGGAISVSNGGDGNVLFRLGSDRAWVFKQTGTDGATALELTAADSDNNNKNFYINTAGRVGIGTQRPQATLDVNGSINVRDDVILGGADCAETFEIEDDGGGIEPGLVMVIRGPGRVGCCSNSYDRSVAGIVSGAGGLKPGVVLGRRAAVGTALSVALAGRVYCRAEATQWPIRIGDLLTTSHIRGHAMLAQDRSRSAGAVIGKAMDDLPQGSGLIPVLVSLQ